MKPMESDWKKFRALLPHLREDYLSKVNKRIIAILTDEQKDSTERFWSSFDEINKEAKILRSCFEGYSRTKMLFYLFEMQNHGMLKDEYLAQFSEELRNELSAKPSY